MTQEEKYMKEAIRQAKKAAAVGDVPIGCVIVHEDTCNPESQQEVRGLET